MINFLSKIFKNNKIQVIGIFENFDNLKINVITLKKSKNKLEIISKVQFNSFDDFKKNLNSSLISILCYDSNKVLNKKVDLTNDLDLSWKKNLDLNIIYHNTYNTDKNIFLSFCKKDLVDLWIQKILSLNIQLVDVYIGSLTSFILARSLNIEKIISNNTELIVKDFELINFSKIESSETFYQIGDSTLTNFDLPLYSLGLKYFTDTLKLEKSEFKNLNNEEIIYKRAFNIFGVTTLMIFFVSLLLSYFSIQYYLSKNAELGVENLYSNKSYNEIVLIESQIKEKEDLIAKSGFLSQYFLSFYSYEILNSVPSSISLDELNINPLIKEIKENKIVEFVPYQIILKGVTKNENEFNKWVKDLKTKKWLNKVSFNSIKSDKNNNTIFELAITIY